MELMKLVMLLCLAGQALGRPVLEPEDLHQDGNGSGEDPTVFEVIEATNRDIPVLLKEGDIVIGISRDAIYCEECRWDKNKNGIVKVPYVIDPQYSASDKSLIIEALKEFEAMTCVQFVNRGSEDDYLYIESKSGCYSSIGRTMGRQSVSLSSPDCMYYGIIQHEAMHNLGFYHEHTRVDRDNYIDIKYENIQEEFLENFDVDEGNTLGLPYDYASVLHYGTYAFSKSSSLPTIIPKNYPNLPLGQRVGMTKQDLLKVNTFYKCNLCREKLRMSSGSFHGNSSSAIKSDGNCMWLIQVARNKISFDFEYLSISSTDYIKVYDGVSKSSPVLLEKTHGHGPIPPLVSSSRNMLVELVSHNPSTFSEFHASYESVIPSS